MVQFGKTNDRNPFYYGQFICPRCFNTKLDFLQCSAGGPNEYYVYCVVTINVINLFVKLFENKRSINTKSRCPLSVQ